MHKYSNDCVVTVIMSTYNGQKNIIEQLESLLNQRDVKINLLIRDDGSNDDTVSIINSYVDKFNKLVVICENNIGATLSFHRAAELALKKCEETDYYAFCDQDDIWLDDKLITGIKAISNDSYKKPNLYFSNLMMMNNNKELIGMLIDDNLVSVSKSNALAAIYTYGCTCIFNRVALEKFCELNKELRYIYHDNWMYAVCIFLGSGHYDNDAHIRYRQTGENVSGEKKQGIKLWIHRFQLLFKFKEEKRIYESISKGLLECFVNEMDADDVCFLNLICNYRNNLYAKIKLLFSNKMKTKSLQKNICIFGRILTNRL